MIVSFDLETTGLDTSNDRIVQIAAVKTDEKLCEVARLTHRLNPGFPMSEEVIKVHGITDEDVTNCRIFAEVAEEIAAFFAGCDISGFNVMGFDIPMLEAELARCDLKLQYERVFDTQALFFRFYQRHLVDALKLYCGKELENAHDAVADTLASIEVLKAQIGRHEELCSFDAVEKYSWGDKIDMAGKFIFNEDGEAVFAFGKHKRKLLQNESGYLGWMLKGDFPEETKEVARKVLKGEIPRRK
jgi:DNA polymerase-3 subunit epsilon